MRKDIESRSEARFALDVLDALEERVESLFSLLGVSDLILRFRELKRALKGEPHGRWIRDRKNTYNIYLPRWEVSAWTALRRFCGLIEIYSDCAAEIVASYPSSIIDPKRMTFFKHAEGLDVVYWMTNRKASAGLDHTIEIIEHEIVDLLRTMLYEREILEVRRIIFSVAPEHLESHELYVSRGYAKLRTCRTTDIIKLLEEERTARQIAALELFDLEKMKERLEDGPAWTGELENAAVDAQIVRERTIAKLQGAKPNLEALIMARDVLVFANGRIEAGFGFRGWPGLVLASVRSAISE